MTPAELSRFSRGEASFARQCSTPGPFDTLDWMDDPSLLVRQPGAVVWPLKVKVFALLALLVIIGGALAAVAQ